VAIYAKKDVGSGTYRPNTRVLELLEKAWFALGNSSTLFADIALSVVNVHKHTLVTSSLY
jgi:hypothetical protein